MQDDEKHSTGQVEDDGTRPGSGQFAPTDNSENSEVVEIIQQHSYEAVTEIVIASLLPLDQQPAAVYLASLRPSGRRTMQQALNVIAGLASGGRCDAFTLNWAGLRYQHTAALRAQLAARYKAATANKMLSALRRVLQEAWRLGQMSAEDYHRAADIRAVRSVALPTGRALPAGEIGQLLQACAQPAESIKIDPAGYRDAALVALLYAAGLRRSEAVGLDMKDYDPPTRGLTVRGGKGGKDRLTYLSFEAGLYLDEWLLVRGKEPGPLFCHVNKAHRLNMRRLSDQAVLWILKQRAKAAGLPSFSPHDMRRTFISDLLDAGADIATVQKLAGHASVSTTARYDRRGEAAKKKAADMIRLPRPSS